MEVGTIGRGTTGLGTIGRGTMGLGTTGARVVGAGTIGGGAMATGAGGGRSALGGGMKALAGENKGTPANEGMNVVGNTGVPNPPPIPNVGAIAVPNTDIGDRRVFK